MHRSVSDRAATWSPVSPIAIQSCGGGDLTLEQDGARSRHGRCPVEDVHRQTIYEDRGRIPPRAVVGTGDLSVFDCTFSAQQHHDLIQDQVVMTEANMKQVTMSIAPPPILATRDCLRRSEWRMGFSTRKYVAAAMASPTIASTRLRATVAWPQ